MKIVIVLALVAIVASLFSALVFLHRDRGHGNRMVKALALRVALSVGLFAFLLIAFRLGWISPSGVR